MDRQSCHLWCWTHFDIGPWVLVVHCVVEVYIILSPITLPQMCGLTDMLAIIWLSWCVGHVIGLTLHFGHLLVLFGLSTVVFNILGRRHFATFRRFRFPDLLRRLCDGHRSATSRLQKLGLLLNDVFQCPNT